MGDLGILSLARAAPALRVLDLTGCVGVTDAGIAHLSSVVGRLEELRLEGLASVSDDGLDALFSSPEEASSEPKLRLLSLAGCAGATDEGLRRIAESSSCRLLVELDISGTSATEEGLVAIAGLEGGSGDGLRRLRRIALPTHGRGIGGRGLKALASLRELTVLDLEGCQGPGVTSEALAGAETRVRFGGVRGDRTLVFTDSLVILTIKKTRTFYRRLIECL